MGKGHWMFDAGSDIYVKGDKDKLGPCLVLPKLTNNKDTKDTNGSNIVKWMDIHNTDTLFGVHENVKNRKVLEGHFNELDKLESARMRVIATDLTACN